MTVRLLVYIPVGRGNQPECKQIAFNPSTTVREALEQIRHEYNLPEDSDHMRYTTIAYILIRSLPPTP